jgi:hypothetical protein
MMPLRRRHGHSVWNITGVFQMFHMVSLGRRALASGFAVAGLAGLLALPLSGTARADTIPFNEVVSFSYNPDATGIGYPAPGCCDYINTVNSAPATPATVTYSQSGAWGSVGAFASADLASGQLKMQASAAMSDDTSYPSIQSNAIFGDGFRATTTGGQPFTWTSASQAQFTINLSGVMNASRALDATFNADLFVILSILNPGTLDPNAPLINGPTAQQYFFWNIGNPTTDIYYTDQDGNHQLLTPTEQYTDIPSTITADFNPGGDFDWVLLLGASGQMSGPGDSFDFDLSHTLTLSYGGPDGSMTTPTSGLFANFDPTLPDASVPEPGSLLILLGALASFAGLRRRA